MGLFSRAGEAVRSYALQRLTPAIPDGRPLGGGNPIIGPVPKGASTDEWTDLIVSSALEWDLRTARGAITSHASGVFAQSGLLVDAMFGDDRIASCMGTRVHGVQGLPFDHEQADKSAAAKECALAFAEDWPLIFPPETLEEALEWEIAEGFSLFEIIWDTSGKRWVPRLKLWHPQFIWYHQALRCYVAIAQEGNAYIRPGDGKWVLFSRHAAYRAWMRGAVRPLVLPWFARQYSYRDWGRFNETHGLPIKQARVPAGASDRDKKGFIAQIRALGAAATILAPETADGQRFALELVEAAHSENAALFEKAMMRGDANVELLLLGQNLSGGEIKGGSFAAAKEAGTVRDDYTLADVTMLSPTIRRQIARPYAAFNFGDPDLASKQTWLAAPPEDASKKATTLKTFADALNGFGTAQLPVDKVALAEQFEVPLTRATDEDDEGQVFEYHFKFGVVTINEARARLGLPPLAGGDVPPTPVAPLGPPPPAALTKRHLSLARDPHAWILAGQSYIDSVADRAARDGALALSRGVTEHVIELVKRARSYDQLRALLAEAFPDLDPLQFDRIVRGATTLAIGAGAFTARKEATE